MADHDLNGILAELARQRRDLEHQLEDTQRSHQSTKEIAAEIERLRKRAEQLASRKIPSR